MAKIKPLMLLPPLIFAGLAGVFYVGMQRKIIPMICHPPFIGQSCACTVMTEALGSLEGVVGRDLERR